MKRKKPDPDWKLVQALGGATKVAALIGTSVQRVQNWKSRGIPAEVKLKHPGLFLPGLQQCETTEA